MKRLIVAMSLAVLAHSAFADETGPPPEVNNTERALPDVAQTERTEQAELGPEQVDPASPDIVAGEETESAATGDSAQSDDETAAADEDSESPAEIDQ
jgi:hypothetical protein